METSGAISKSSFIAVVNRWTRPQRASHGLQRLREPLGLIGSYALVVQICYAEFNRLTEVIAEMPALALLQEVGPQNSKFSSIGYLSNPVSYYLRAFCLPRVP
jgi:hypothetical protein